MKTEPVRPAHVRFDGDGQGGRLPYAPDFGDVYHTRAGAEGQARQVFLGGNGLPARWAGRRDFTVLETGFGLGHNFLATWRAWREDPQRGARLHYVSIEKHPPTRDTLATAHGLADGSGPTPAACPLARELLAHWPSLTPNLHPLDLDGGRVQLLLAFFDVRAVLPEIVAQVDAFYLDGFAPARNPAMWEPRVLKALGRLAAPGATAATWSVARALRDGLSTAGFAVEKAPGFGGKREMTVARYAPHTGTKRAPSRLGRLAEGERVAIVGGGLAGCATAAALAALGIESVIVERHAAPAAETSGQAAGLFHGIVLPEDGPHARFNRAAALCAARAIDALNGLGGAAAETASSRVAAGRPLRFAHGVLRLDFADGGVAAMRALLERQGLPPDHLRAVDMAEASALAGLPLHAPAWWFPQGGAVSPRALAAAWCAAAGPALRWRGGLTVDAIHPDGSGWALVDAAGHTIERATHLVLANAADAQRLLAPWAGAVAWPLQLLRGQTSTIGAAHWAALGLPVPRCAVSGHGYLLPPDEGRVLFGATSQDADGDAAVRVGDHARNLQRLEALLGRPLPAVDQLPDGALHGRVGWRLATDDRLPLIGAPADPCAAAGPHADQVRWLPRLPGLHVFTALASRGLTWAALGARTLAALIAGTPAPLESSLLDAVDAARFAARASRRGAGTTGTIGTGNAAAAPAQRDGP